MFGDSLVFNSKVFVRFCCSEVQKLFAQGRNLRFVFRTLAAIPKSKMRARFSGITYTMHQGGSCNTEVSSGLSRATKWSFKFRKFGRKFGRKVARNEGLLGVAWFRCRARMFKHCFKVCSPNTSRTCFSMFWRFFVLFFFLPWPGFFNVRVAVTNICSCSLGPSGAESMAAEEERSWLGNQFATFWCIIMILTRSQLFAFNCLFVVGSVTVRGNCVKLLQSAVTVGSAYVVVWLSPERHHVKVFRQGYITYTSMI